MDDACDDLAGGPISADSSIPLRHWCITGGFAALMLTLLVTTSDRLVRFNRSCANIKRQEVTGSVYYQGQPLRRGTICFLAQMVEADMEFTDAQAAIRDGAFSIPRHRGPMPGWYRVRVTADKSLSLFNPRPAPIPRSAERASRVITARIDGPIFVRIQRRPSHFDFSLN